LDYLRVFNFFITINFDIKLFINPNNYYFVYYFVCHKKFNIQNLEFMRTANIPDNEEEGFSALSAYNILDLLP
jgi:hypothetical protein